MAKFTDALIDEILSKTDFISIYKEKVRLVRKGGKWWGLCPFHAEKTPSFSVDAERGLFYCFGCQKGGSLIDFLMDTEKSTFPEVVAELAERAHVRMPDPVKEDSVAEGEFAQMKSLNEKLAGAFHWLLLNHKSGERARSLLRRRKIDEGHIESFRLGYAPADPQWLHKFLTTKGFSAEFLARSGLFSARNPKYPLFSDRLMFPIADPKGQIIAFGGRLLEGDGPKYINSPDTILFRKQEQLFAMDKALPEIRKSDEALICEGYMDAISFHCAGVSNAVAPLGTAFTLRQAQSLRRRCERVLLCFDSDEAGQRAAERACATAAQAGLEAKVLHLGEGKDASEILENHGADALKKAVGYSINSGDFLLRRAEALFDLGSGEGRIKAFGYFLPYLEALGSEMGREAFLDAIGRRLGMSPATLRSDYERARQTDSGRSREGETSSRATELKKVARTADLVYMTAVALAPESFPSLSESIREADLEDQRARSVYRALETARERGISETASILALVDDEEARRFVLSCAASGELALGISKIIEDGSRAVRVRSLEKEQVRLAAELGATFVNGVSATDADQMGLLRRKMNLDAELARLKGEIDE